MRLDNAYSFEIMEKTINAVIPVLIKKDEAATRKRPAQASVDEVVTFILQVMVMVILLLLLFILNFRLS